jgi:hypothetical protein
MNDICQTISDEIVAEIEEGADTSRMPWPLRQGSTGLQQPRHVAGRACHGVNVPILPLGDGRNPRLRHVGVGHLQTGAWIPRTGSQGYV